MLFKKNINKFQTITKSKQGSAEIMSLNLRSKYQRKLCYRSGVGRQLVLGGQISIFKIFAGRNFSFSDILIIFWLYF